MKKKGSALLLVILITSAIVICSTIVWQGTAFLSDLVLKRQEYEQKYRFTEGVLNYGIAFCKCNYDAIQKAVTKGEKTFTITLEADKISPHQIYMGKIYVEVQDKSIELKAVLVDNAKEIFSVGCNLSKQQVLKNSVQKKYDTKFLVQNFVVLPK